MRIALISSYPPRQCGIGVFTHDLWTHLTQIDPEEPPPIVLAMNTSAVREQDYPPQVRFLIQRDAVRDYRQAAHFINSSSIDLVCVQHEFGLFGGDAGDMLFQLLERLQRPIVVALHTVLRKPEPAYRSAVMRISDLASKLIVLSETAGKFLRDVYHVPASLINHIPHGAPDRPFIDPSFYKAKFHLSGRRVILTFGLLGPGKGLETALEAMPKVVKAHPEVTYVILGATHPEQRRTHGEEYRLRLQRMVKNLNLGNHVIFVNRYVELEELCEYLHASDVYVTPYPSREQISSGTLTYALALGKCIVSTDYHYANELLADGRGVLVPPQDASAMADSLIEVLRDEVRRDHIRRDAYGYGRKLVWPNIAHEYFQLFNQCVLPAVRPSRRLFRTKPVMGTALPELKLDYFLTLADETGLFQHANHQTPEWKHGYCTDDNARALIVSIRNQGATELWDANRYITRFLGFVYNAQCDDGTFRNFLSFDRRWLERTGSDDCLGRCIWATGYTIRHCEHRPHRLTAKVIFDRALPSIRKLAALRPLAYAIRGMTDYLHSFSGARDVQSTLNTAMHVLAQSYHATASGDWQWFEDSLTWGNGNLSYAMLKGAHLLNNEEYKQIGLDSMEFLDKQVWLDGRLSPVGNKGWLGREGRRAQFDQQAIDVVAMVRLYQFAYEITGDADYLHKMNISFDWFLGNNDLGLPLYDFKSGACADGLNAMGINQNCGAESTLAYLMALSVVQDTRASDSIHSSLSETSESQEVLSTS